LKPRKEGELDSKAEKHRKKMQEVLKPSDEVEERKATKLQEAKDKLAQVKAEAGRVPSIEVRHRNSLASRRLRK
jgi:hypothetical protein